MKECGVTVRRLFLILCLIPTLAQAGVYTWVDDKGRTHFGDRPPAESNSEPVEVTPPPPDADNLANERRQRMNEFLDSQHDERQSRQAAKAEADQQAAKEAELCRKLQARLKHMASVSTFYNLNEQGERVYVSEEENDRIRERFRTKVQEKCG